MSETRLQHSAIAPAALEFLRWVASRSATYDEAFEAWQTSCPRLSVWEDSFIDGLVQREGSMVTLTARGRTILDASTA